jgi:hypothetical protein
MPNIVNQTGGAVAAYAAGANPWAEAARGVETGAYLKFNGNDGIWSFGQDDDELPEKSRVVGDMESMAFGWTCWVDSNVEEEVYVAVVEGKPPMEHELNDHGPYNQDDGWRESSSLSLVLESYGEDDQDEAVGTAMLWKSSTGGQVRQVKKLSGAYGRLFAQHPGEYPIIELGAESYVPKNKKHGKIKWSPTLKIVGWMTAAELEGLSGGAGAEDDDDFEEPTTAKRLPAPVEEEEEAPAPAPRGRRAAAPVEEEEAPAPAPRGRRAAAPAPVEEEDEAPAPAPRGRRAAAVPAVEEEEEAPAPAPRGRRAAAPAPAEDEADDVAPAPRGRRRGAPVEDAPADDEGEADAAPAPRGRSGGRGAPPANARLRKFD